MLEAAVMGISTEEGERTCHPCSGCSDFISLCEQCRYSGRLRKSSFPSCLVRPRNCLWTEVKRYQLNTSRRLEDNAWRWFRSGYRSRILVRRLSNSDRTGFEMVVWHGTARRKCSKQPHLPDFSQLPETKSSSWRASGREDLDQTLD